MSLVGTKFINFTAPAVVEGSKIVEEFSLDNFVGEYYIVLVFYTADFTFLCPTELHKIQSLMPEFEKRKTVVVAISTDSQYAHLQWLKMPKEKGGIEGISFPIVSDQTLTISSNYGVLAGNYGFTEQGESVFDGLPFAFRATFIIDRQGIIRSEFVQDINVGRSIEEILRTLDAIMYFDKSGELCPADWKLGQRAIKPNFKDFSNFMKNFDV